VFREIGYFDFGTYADEYSCRVFFLNCRKVAFADGEFHYFHGNPEAITKQVSGRRLDDTYNNYRLWLLTHERFPGYEWDRKMAGKALRSLMESGFLISQHRELEAEAWRLQPAIEGMNGDDFLASLKDYFAGRPGAYRLARSIIRRPRIRRLATAAHVLGRKAKQSLPGLARSAN
jgi:hypothetical protein